MAGLKMGADLKMSKLALAVAAAAAAGLLLATGCGGGTEQVPADLSRAEVEAIVSEQLAQAPATAQSEPGFTSDDVQEAIDTAIAVIPEPEPGLSRAEIEQIVGSAVESLLEPQPALTAVDVERIVGSAIAAFPEPPAGLSRAEVDEAIQRAIAEAIAAMAESQPVADGGVGDELSAPSKSDPAAYTKFVVGQAIARYEAEGRDAVLVHYNSAASIDDQWYVFIIDENDTVIGHYDPDRRGLDVKGWVGTDINGYNFGPEMLAADESGRWVPYVYVNPVEGTLGDEGVFELKNAWVVRHDGLLFASGWYINNEEFAPQLISESAEHFRRGGLEAILEFSNDPQGISAGLIPTVEYYNSTDTLDGYFTGFVAAPDGEILSHFDPALIGTDIEDLLGPAVRNATAEGVWITAEDNPAGAAGPHTMRMWVIDVDGTLIGGGWYNHGND